MSTSLSQRFAFGLIWNFIGKIMIGLCGAVMSILIARNLGKAELGIYASVITIPATLRLFSSFGFETILNVKLPLLRTAENCMEKMRFLIRKLLFFRFLVISVVAACFFLARGKLVYIFKGVDIINYLPAVILYLAALMFFSYFTMIFRALMQIKFVASIEAVSQVLNLLFLLLFFYFGYGVKGVLFAFVISNFITTAYLCYSAREFIAGKASEAHGEMLQIGLASSLGAFICFGLGSQADILLLNYFQIPAEKIGFYFLCFSLTSMMGFHLEGLGALSQSVFSEAYAKNGEKGLSLSWPLLTEVLVLFTLPVYIFAVFNADLIMKLLYGPQFLEAAVYFKIFALFSCASILAGSSFCMPVFYLIKKKKLGLTIQLAGGAINIALNLILIPKFGVLGVVLATGFSQALADCIMMLFVHYFTRMTFPLFFEFKMLIVCIVSIMPSIMIEDGNFFSLASKIIVYGIFFLFMSFIVRPLNEKAKELAVEINPKFFRILKYF